MQNNAAKISFHILAKYVPVSFSVAQDGELVIHSHITGHSSIRISDPELRVQVIAQLRDHIWEEDHGYARTVCA